MVFDSITHNIYFRRFIAGSIDFGIEFSSGLLGGYFGAMMAALVIVLNEVSPSATQAAIWTGMSFGFIFWGVVASLVNRVLVQGVSRSTVGKKMMDLEIVSVGEPISWEAMLKHWISGTMIGKIEVISSLDQSKIAPVYSITAQQAIKKSDVADDSSDKKAA